MALYVITRQGFRKSWQMARQGKNSGPKVPAVDVPSGRMGSLGTCKLIQALSPERPFKVSMYVWQGELGSLQWAKRVSTVRPQWSVCCMLSHLLQV
jgi:hypothetical protein